MPSDMEQLDMDLEELRRLLSDAKMTRTKKILSNEIQVVEREIETKTKAIAAEAAAAAILAENTSTSKSATSDSTGEKAKQVNGYPSSSNRGPKNWDAIAKQADEEEEKEATEGDGAVNKLFQKIYADASDDVKKAMIKSYSESGGTCLSTDWKDVSKKKVKVKPPAGMEFKKWDD